MAIIKLIDISKKYKKNQVLNNISYSFKKGMTYLLLGPNGSGKSTLIKAILDLVIYQGTIIKDNLSFSYIPEAINFPDYVTVASFLETLARMKKIHNKQEKINNLLYQWDLYQSREKLIKNLSKGMKQKLLIINSLVGEADVYIFDEPLNGLDYQMQQQFLKTIINLKDQNKTIIISTHYVNFYEKIYHIILEIRDGKLYEKTI